MSYLYSNVTGLTAQQKITLAEAGIEAGGGGDNHTYDMGGFQHAISSDDESSYSTWEDSHNIAVEVSRDGELADEVQRETFQS